MYSEHSSLCIYSVLIFPINISIFSDGSFLNRKVRRFRNLDKTLDPELLSIAS